MAFLGVLEAVRHRLEGNAADSAPDIDTLYAGVGAVPNRLVGVQEAATVDAALRRNTFSRVGSIEVPIHFFDGGGQHFELVYPSLTFDIIGTQPRYDEYVFQSKDYRGDMYSENVETSSRTIIDGGEDIGSHPRMVKRRFVEHPYDIQVEVRAYAKDPLFMSLLEMHVMSNVFEPRGFLRVPMRNGTTRDWDMIFQDAQDLDRRDAVRSGSPGVEREYAKAWTWKVEGYLDNTDREELVNLVQRRTITTSSLVSS